MKKEKKARREKVEKRKKEKKDTPTNVKNNQDRTVVRSSQKEPQKENAERRFEKVSSTTLT